MLESVFTEQVRELLLPVESTCRFYETPEGDLCYTLYPEELPDPGLTWLGVARSDARGRVRETFSAAAWEAARTERAQRRGRWAGHKGNCAECQEGPPCPVGAPLQAAVRIDCANGGTYGKRNRERAGQGAEAAGNVAVRGIERPGADAPGGRNGA